MKHSRRMAVAALASVLCAVSFLLRAQEAGGTKSIQARLKAAEKGQSGSAIDEVLSVIFATHRFEQAAISPNGQRVAWVEDVVSRHGMPTGKTVIYVAELDSPAKPRRISAESADAIGDEGSVAWSRDSSQIAFLSDAAKAGQLQLYVASAAGGPARKLTSVKGFLQAPAFSPDGKTLAVLFTENMTKAAGPLVAEEHPTGVIKDAFYEQRLALVDTAGGNFRQISPADTYVYEYDWSPDGRHFVVSSAQGNGDNNWWIAQLSTLDATSGLMKPLYKPALQIASPIWSPDGKRIAFIHGLMSDEGITGGDVYVVSASGGEAQNLTPESKSSASWISWTKAGKILTTGYLNGNSAIAILDPANRGMQPLWQGDERLQANGWGPTISVADDGKTVGVIRQAMGTPPDVWAGAIGSWKQITHKNAKLQPAWGAVKSLTWKSDGHDVQGWLLYPHNFDPSKKYPLVVQVHGGPSYAAMSDWPAVHAFSAPLSGSGYFVLEPNPRGSYGQGEAFTRANVKDFGYGDFRDIMAGVDAAIKAAPIDESRLGLTGWSYGGYMTMWGVTQTNRFKAAVAGAGLANWQSYYGENQIDQWMIPFFGKSVYDDPEVYAKSAPITFIKKVKTPTLVVVGDSDGECPTPQSYEFWHALKTQNVETELVVYDHEGHLFASPKHQRDVLERMVAWFNGHLK